MSDDRRTQYRREGEEILQYTKHLTKKNVSFVGVAAIITAVTPIILLFYQGSSAKQSTNDLASTVAPDILNISLSILELTKDVKVLEARIESLHDPKKLSFEVEHINKSIQAMKDSASVSRYEKWIDKGRRELNKEH